MNAETTDNGDRYWEYLMSADSSPVTFMLVAVPAIIGLSIVAFAMVARVLRRKREAAWLDAESRPPIEKESPHGS